MQAPSLFHLALASLDNSPERYGTVAVALHWLAAALIAGMLVLGLYMVSLPDAGYDRRKIVLIVYHKEFGVLALLLVLARLAWRLRGPMPCLEPAADWQKIAARFAHLWLYTLMFALPLSGWLMSSAAALPVSFFGLGSLPDLVARDDHLFRVLRKAHAWLAYGLIAVLVAHVGAALWHHLVRHDATLRKMLPLP